MKSRFAYAALFTTWIAITAAGTQAALAAQTSVKIGILDDMSGVYADLAGAGSVTAAKMAIEDFAKVHPEISAQLASADHQNRADIGASIARKWFDQEGVDVVVDMLNSSVALAVEQIAKTKDKVVIATSVGAPDFTGKACTPQAMLWTQDTYAITHAAVQALVGRGLKKWFFVAVDYSFGRALVEDAKSAIDKSGGHVVGAVYHPLGESDMSSYLLQAQASDADVIAFADAGNDMITAIKQAHEFDVGKTKQLVALSVYITDLHALGLEAARGLFFSSPYDMDRDAASLDWAKRFSARTNRMPTLAQASVYSAVQHYLSAVAKVGGTATSSVIEAMRETPVDDIYAHGARLRADGVLVHDMYLMRAKQPSESKGPWDLMERVATVPGSDAFRPLAESECPAIRH